MKIKLFVLCALYVLLISISCLFNFGENIIARITVVETYLFVVILAKFLFRNNLINLVSSLSYDDDFDLSKNGKQYLEYAYRLSLIIFIPAISLSIILHLLNISYFADIALGVFLIIVWCVLIYNKSKKLR